MRGARLSARDSDPRGTSTRAAGGAGPSAHALREPVPRRQGIRSVRFRLPGADLVHFEAHPSDRSLRGFGVIGLFVFGAAASAAWGGGVPARAAAAVLAGVGIFGTLASLLRPRCNRPLYLALSALGYPLAWLSAWTLLIAVFFLVVTPSAVFYRAFVRRRTPSSGSAWHASQPRDKDSYFRQF